MPVDLESSATRSPTVRGDLVVALGLAAVCLALYVGTLCPGLAFPVMDGHELTVNTARLGVAHPSGYPLYTWAAFLFIHLVPFGEVAYRMNLFSAVCAAAAVAVLYLVGRRLALRPVAAAAGALLLGWSTDFWAQAVMAEVYTPNVLVVGLTLLALLGWAAAVHAGHDGTRRFVAFAAVYGASIGVHLSNLGFAPAFAVFVLATDPGMLRRPRQVAWALAVFGLMLAQYLWLPLRGGRFDQYPNVAPTDLPRLYQYTLGAFSALRFAFPLAVLPQRLGFYVQVAKDNLGMAGLVAGTLGAWVLVLRSPARFWLLGGMLFVNVFVFAQFAVYDVRVFFVVGYVAWALLAAHALDWLLGWIDAPRWPLGAVAARVARGGIAVALLGTLASMAAANRVANDARGDTVVGDFGRNVFDALPQGSYVTARRGAFGADMLYWQIAEGLRPDVTILGQRGALPPRDPEVPRFSTVRIADGRPTHEGWQGQTPEDLPPRAWYVPVLFGNSRAFTLARVLDAPPALVVAAGPSGLGAPIRAGGVLFHGATVGLRHGDGGGRRLAVESWWQPPSPERVVLSTRLGERTLESHELGLGNLARYAAEVGWPAGGVVHERFEVVVPATVPRGEHVVQLGVVRFDDAGFATDWLEVGHVIVE